MAKSKQSLTQEKVATVMDFKIGPNRAIARTLMWGRGGVYMHIFMFCLMSVFSKQT